MGQPSHPEGSGPPTTTTRRAYLHAVGTSGAVLFAGRGSFRRHRCHTITLGGSVSLTGSYAALGRLYWDAYRLTARRINRAGGVSAGDGETYRLGLRLRNDGSDAARCRSTYEQLVDHQHVDYLLGPYSSALTLEASDVAGNRERPMVQGSGASPDIFQTDGGWIFGLLPPADTYAVSTIELAAAQSPAPTTAALLTEDDPFSRSSADGAREALDGVGIDVVVDETFPSDATELSSLLDAVGEQAADLLILSAHESQAIDLANGLAAADVHPALVMATVGSLTATFREQTGSNRDYLYGPSPWNDAAEFDDPVYGSTAGFQAAIEAAFGYRPDYHSAAAAAAVETFQDAFQRVEDRSPETVRDAIADVDVETAYGPISFGADGVIDRDMVVYQWQPQDGGESVPVLVWPTAVQEAPPVYPMPG